MVDDDEAAIAEFHAAAKRRRRRIMAITALACAAIGIAILVVALTAERPEGAERFEARTLAIGLAFLGGAVVSTGMAVRGD